MDFDRSTRSRLQAAGEEAVEESLDEAEGRRDMTVHPEALSESWPRCPQCGAPRITKCPACGTSGTGFPPADEPPDSPPATPLLLCIECDEPFTPEYARDCEWCGHEFPDGSRPPEHAESEAISPALLGIVGATVLLMVGLFAYFAYILH